MNSIERAQTATLCLLLMLSPGPSALGQTTSTDTPSRGVKPPKDSSQKVVWDLEIADGRLRKGDQWVPATMGTIIAYLRDKNPSNVVLAPGVDKIQIRDLKLFGSVWDQALEALRVASGNAFAWSPPRGEGNIDPATGLLTQSGVATDFYAVTLEPGAAINRGGRSVQVYNLTDYLKGKDEQEAERALNEIKQITLSTLEDLRGDEPAPVDLPSFRFHAGAKLLVLTGSPEALESGRRVVLAFPGVTSSEPAGAGYAGVYGTAGAMGRYGAGGTGVVAPRPNPEMDDMFRKRYGLGSGSQGQPGRLPVAPPPAKTPPVAPAPPK